MGLEEKDPSVGKSAHADSATIGEHYIGLFFDLHPNFTCIAKIAGNTDILVTGIQ